MVGVAGRCDIDYASPAFRKNADDEYDTPMQEAYVNGYWKEMADFIRSMLNAAFKTNPFMERYYDRDYQNYPGIGFFRLK